jgi:hypothetical protein
MIREEIRHLSTTRRDLRKFGLLVGGVFALIALWCYLKHKPAWPYLATPGLALMLLGSLLPCALKHVYTAWMALAFMLGLIISTLLLTLFFFLVITPIGLITRLAGKDFLSLKLNRQAKSYWLQRDPSAMHQPGDYERQF